MHNPLEVHQAQLGEIYFNLPDAGRGVRTNFVDNIQYARNIESRKIVLSVGGAQNRMSFTNRTKSQTFVNSVVDLYTQFGGFDGLDWNTFEADQTLDTDEIIWISTQLKSLYSNFLITAPPAPWNPRDLTFCQVMVQANALDYAAPQYYDEAEQSYIVENINPWVSAFGASNVVVEFGVANNQTNYMTVEQAVATWNQIQSTYPDIRGVFNWKIDTDEDQGWTFTNNIGPFVTENK
jgi:chitinase